MDTDDLPFLKRYAYRDENEFRALYVDMHEAKEFERVEVSLDCISRVTLSPWMAKPLAEAVKEALRALNGCTKLRVSRSTLINNDQWKRLANPKLKG